MFDYNTMTGAVAYPAEKLNESADDSFRRGETVKGCIKTFLSSSLDTLNVTAMAWGYVLIALGAAAWVNEKFHK